MICEVWLIVLATIVLGTSQPLPIYARDDGELTGMNNGFFFAESPETTSMIDRKSASSSPETVGVYPRSKITPRLEQATSPPLDQVVLFNDDFDKLFLSDMPRPSPPSDPSLLSQSQGPSAQFKFSQQKPSVKVTTPKIPRKLQESAEYSGAETMTGVMFDKVRPRKKTIGSEQRNQRAFVTAQEEEVVDNILEAVTTFFQNKDFEEKGRKETISSLLKRLRELAITFGERISQSHNEKEGSLAIQYLEKIQRNISLLVSQL